MLTEMQRWAQDAVGTALTQGRLVRQSCEQCGHAKAQAHHDDYAKPLEVRWLCVSCHRVWHWHNEAKNKDGVPPRTERGQRLYKSFQRFKRPSSVPRRRKESA